MTPIHKNTWMPFYMGDFLASTSRLSHEEKWAYMLLIWEYWQNGGPIKNDKKTLKKVTGISSKKLEQILSFFELRDGFLIHARVDSEIAKSIEKQEKNQHRTAAAREAKLLKQRSVTDSVTDIVTTPLTEPATTHTTTTTYLYKEKNIQKEKRKKSPKQPPGELPDWIPKDQWEAYLRVRKAKRAPVTRDSFLGLIAKLDKLRQAGNSPANVLQRSVDAGWTGLFELPEKERNATAAAIKPKLSAEEELVNKVGYLAWTLRKLKSPLNPVEEDLLKTYENRHGPVTWDNLSHWKEQQAAKK